MNLTVKNIIVSASLSVIGIAVTIAMYPYDIAYQILCPVEMLVFLCALSCGRIHGLLCGIITPIVSFLLIGIPRMALIPSTLLQFIIIALLAPYIMYGRAIDIRNKYLRLYASIIIPLVIGRLIEFVFLFFIVMRGDAVKEVINLCFVKSLPGTALHLTLLPAAYMIFEKLGFNFFDTVMENEMQSVMDEVAELDFYEGSYDQGIF